MARPSGVRTRTSDLIATRTSNGKYILHSFVAVIACPYRVLIHLQGLDRPLCITSGPPRTSNMETPANAMLLEQSNCHELGPMIRCYSSSQWGTLFACSICRDQGHEKEKWGSKFENPNSNLENKSKSKSN